jgi:hypothetical protein
MYAFVVFLGLALGLTVIMQVIDELLPLKAPAALSRTIGFAWALDYSVFTAFGQDFRQSWMHPVATGLALVGGGEFVRSLVLAVSHRSGDAPVEVAPTHVMRAA